ncbi:hypothetical protein JCM18905_4057 [Vibrio sp. JCM 18905]|nr:hypothetical protein JCM18905_4057 [Vibrio sp. JCM 18905]
MRLAARAPLNMKAHNANTALATTKMPPPINAENPQSGFMATAIPAATKITAPDWIINNCLASSRPGLANAATMYSYL